MRYLSLLFFLLLAACRHEAPTTAPPSVDPRAKALAGWVTNNLDWLSQAYEGRSQPLSLNLPPMTGERDDKGRLKLALMVHPSQLLWSFADLGETRELDPRTPAPKVTLAPQMKDWCKAELSWSSDDLYVQAEEAVRLNMWLGEPPTTGAIFVVEIWAEETALAGVGVMQDWSPDLPAGTLGASLYQLAADATYRVIGSWGVMEYCQP